MVTVSSLVPKFLNHVDDGICLALVEAGDRADERIGRVDVIEPHDDKAAAFLSIQNALAIFC
jgi:hypothetical protein